MVYVVGTLRGADAISQGSEQNTRVRDERFTESATRSTGRRDVSTTLRRVAVRASVKIPRGHKRHGVRTRLPFAELNGVSERAARATLTIVEAPIVYAGHIIAPLPFVLYD